MEEKKYKNGLVLGKFYPVSKGHLYLIDTALENSESVDVICCINKSQFIGEERYKALTEIYKNKENVRVHLVSDDGLPQKESECNSLDEFYSHWTSLVYNTVDKLDVVFTSEDYGDDFARYLGIEHFLVDKERKKFPISGTKIRDNPFEHWKFIPDEMKIPFIKKIALVGPESVGKSTMTKKLATYFNTNFVVEYGRTVYESQGNKINIDDFIPISLGRQSLEDWSIKISNKILFCDTEDITTYLFSKMYFPNDYKKIEKDLINFIDNSNFSLYILLKPDCKGIQDGTRNFLEERESHYNSIKSELDLLGCNYIEVGGNWEERFKSCISYIKSNFNI